MAFVKSTAIEGLSVYGVQQKDYTVGDKQNCDYVQAASAAMLQEARAIEAETAAYAAVLRARQKKLDELGWALSLIVETVSSMDSKKPSSSDMSSPNWNLNQVSQILAKYRRASNADMRLPVSSGNTVRRDDVTKAQAAVQYEIDYETNEMQQNMVTMQSLVSKRDNAFATASALIKKINSTAATLVGNQT